VTTLNGANNNGAWKVAPSDALAAGTYTVVADQTKSGLVGHSAPNTFTVDTSAPPASPSVAITAPDQGATVGTATPQVSGTASAASDVTVKIYAGSSASGTPVQNRTTPVAAGSWSLTATSLANGTYTVTASQTDASGNTGTSAPVTFTVNTAPTVTGVTPSTVGQGARQFTVRVNGSNFVANATVTFSDAGVSGSVTATTSTQLTVAVNAASDAITGSRNVTVVNPDGQQATCTGCLTVVAGPQVASVSPSSIKRGVATTVTVVGSGLQKNAKIDVSGSGVNVSKITWVSSTQMTAVLSPTKTAATGARSLTVTNPDGGTFVCTGCVTVVT
jgi:hypothetical protein